MSFKKFVTRCSPPRTMDIVGDVDASSPRPITDVSKDRVESDLRIRQLIDATLGSGRRQRSRRIRPPLTGDQKQIATDSHIRLRLTGIKRVLCDPDNRIVLAFRSGAFIATQAAQGSPAYCGQLLRTDITPRDRAARNLSKLSETCRAVSQLCPNLSKNGQPAT